MNLLLFSPRERHLYVLKRLVHDPLTLLMFAERPNFGIPLDGVNQENDPSDLANRASPHDESHWSFHDRCASRHSAQLGA